MADFRIPKKFVSDWEPRNSIHDQIRKDSVCRPHNLDSDKLPDMKWWLHVKSNLECEPNYSCKTEELGDFYAEFVGGNVKNGEDQSIIDFDDLSYVGSDDLSVDQQPRHVSPTHVKNNKNTRMRKIEASVNNDLHFTPKKKDQKEFGFSDGRFMDCDVSDFPVSEKMASHLMGNEKPGPWWRTAGKDELASFVAQKSVERVENCDLPNPQSKHFRQIFTKGVDNDKIPPSSLNQKAQTGSSNADGYTSATTTSFFPDSNSHFSSGQSKESGSSNKDCQINPENSSITELLEALCHSQTRAREAEKAAQEAYNEKEHIVSLFFKQASQLFAYKQWFYMLQLENLCLQLRNKNQPLLNLFPHRETQPKKNRGRAEKRKINSNKKCGIGKCVAALAVGLSLAGAGLLLGWTMGWMFPSS
ncbi:hypothetical protein L195_g010377 [Trifolium pratense]|uniref:Transmembrane protein n=1 Tax=Trifolium pratense TaxID=57577 RepID=A0A2K3PEP8_TRIPR|nr:hypothetical protein L195_g010377 [Trifolium pratense]